MLWVSVGSGAAALVGCFGDRLSGERPEDICNSGEAWTLDLWALCPTAGAAQSPRRYHAVPEAAGILPEEPGGFYFGSQSLESELCI